MPSPNILISGSGIAGSVLASWLLRAYSNATITIVERAPSFRLTGASVDIRSSAVDIIKWMGAEQEIRNHSTKEEGIQFVKADGKPVATFAATGRTDYQSVTSEFEIFRGALAHIFMSPIQDRLNLIFDESVQSYEERDNKVFVTFKKSKEVKPYDMLVAADGLSSKIRGMMLDSKPEEQIDDEGIHVAYFTLKSDLLEGGRLAKWYSAPGGRCVFLRPDPNPAGRTRGNLMYVTTKKDVEKKKILNQALRDGNERYMLLMEELYQDAGWLTTEVLRGMHESDDFYCSPFAQVKSPRLQTGRVVLLGDAGYARPGFGTSLAIIGGYILAGELLNHQGDVEAATKGYEELMVPFVNNCQRGSGAMQWINPQTQFGIEIRNAVLGFVTGMKLDKLAMSAAAALGFAETKVAMPDYQWPAA